MPVARQSCVYFQNYLTSLRERKNTTAAGDPNDLNLRIFQYPRPEQLKIIKRIEASGKLDAFACPRDEDAINGSLMAILAGITIKHPDVTSQFNTDRIPMKAVFERGSYEARLDGFLRSRLTGKVQAIIEVKGRRRQDLDIQVSMQETCKMVAWLKTAGHVPHRDRYS